MVDGKMIAHFSDDELASALHFIDAHDSDMDGFDLRAWERIREMIVNAANQLRSN